MRIALRLAAALLASALLYAVVRLGILSGTDTRFVVWFGIASAIAAPVGLSLLGFALSRSDTGLIQRLAKVPAIERLMAEAQTQEEKLRVLQEEQARLAEIIRLESRRQTARDRKESLERDAQRILKELTLLDTELASLDEQVGESVAAEEIAALRQRLQAREKGDVIIRFAGKTLRFDRDIVRALPFGTGNITLAYLRVLEGLQTRRP